MNIESTPIKGAYIITRDIQKDERGYFSRAVDVRELSERGLSANFVQISLSKNLARGTLRGLHSQSGEFAEDKLILCSRGEIFDVCVDVEQTSPTFGQYVCAVLSEENGKAMYIPKGCAHGFVTLVDDSQLVYFMTQYYHPEAECGFRYVDKVFGIKWPIEPTKMSNKDKAWRLL